jgi:hypothetical protein
MTSKSAGPMGAEIQQGAIRTTSGKENTLNVKGSSVCQ